MRHTGRVCKWGTSQRPRATSGYVPRVCMEATYFRAVRVGEGGNKAFGGVLPSVLGYKLRLHPSHAVRYEVDKEGELVPSRSVGNVLRRVCSVCVDGLQSNTAWRVYSVCSHAGMACVVVGSSRDLSTFGTVEVTGTTLLFVGFAIVGLMWIVAAIADWFIDRKRKQ